MNKDIESYIAQLARMIKVVGHKYISLHYTGVNADTSAQSISWYHKHVLGYKRDGYHRFINHDGVIEMLEPITFQVSGMYSPLAWEYIKDPNGFKEIRNILPVCFQICFETLKDLKMSAVQEEVLIAFFKKAIEFSPDILIGGHNEFPFSVS